MNFATPEKKVVDHTIQEKLFTGKPFDATAFEKKFKKANEVGRTIKGFNDRKK